MTTANSQFFAILTAVGEAKQANANALGVPWTFSQLGVGDANNTDPIPSREQTRLINERRRAPLNQLKIDPANASIIIAEQVIPPDVGGWWIREIGLYDADGDLVAVANCAPSFKPLLSQGTGKTQVVRLNIIVTSTANVQLKIDPTVVLATRTYVDVAILEVLPKNKAPGEYTRVKINDRGLVVSGDNPTTLAGNGISDAYTKEQVDAIIAQASALPVGAMVAFPVDKVAPGFLEVDGSVKSVAAYPDLAAFLGSTFNKGDEGAGNFRLPESRAEFLRGWDHGRGVDAGRTVGSTQAGSGLRGTASSSVQGSQGNIWSNVEFDEVGSVNFYHSMASGSNISVQTGVVRPRNLAVMWCIKAWNAPINQGNIDIAALSSNVDKLGKNGPIAGSARGLRASVPVAAATVPFSADWVVVEDAGGKSYRLKNFSQQINLASAVKGLGAMDVGAAPVSGYVAVYALYNPDTGLQGATAVDATASVAPNLCAGVIPAGYTASALISVWRVAGSLFVAGYQEDRRYSSPFVGLLDINSDAATLVPVSIAGYVPKNAKTLSGQLVASNNSASGTSVAMDVAATASGIGGKYFNAFVLVGGTSQAPFSDMPIIESQTMYTIRTIGTGPARYSMLGSGYTF